MSPAFQPVVEQLARALGDEPRLGLDLHRRARRHAVAERREQRILGRDRRARRRRRSAAPRRPGRPPARRLQPRLERREVLLLRARAPR